MKYLIETIPPSILMSDVPVSDIVHTADALEPWLAEQHPEESKRMIAAMAYQFGIKQGIHNARARKKGEADHG